MPVLVINGTRTEYGAAEFPATGAELLSRLGLEPRHVVAEVDGAVVPRAAFATYALRDGQQIELVQFVGGG